jgi:hypothetical protein
MRRRSILAVLVLGSLLAAAPSVAAAGATFHFSSKGLGAEGGWTTASGTGSNTVFTDTFIFTSRDSFTEDGQTFTEPSIFVDQFSYKFDRRGNFVFISDRFGFASGADVDLSVDSKLRWASVSALVPFESCDERSCSPDGTDLVEASWTGTGSVIRISQTFHAVSKEFTESGQFKGSFRNADATATVGGVDVGEQFFADIFNATFRDVFVCHHC